MSWRYDENSAALILVGEGTQPQDWEGTDLTGHSLAISGAGFSPPSELKRPKDQDQTAPWLTDFPRFRCWVTTIRLPASKPGWYWTYRSKPVDRTLGGVAYSRRAGLSNNVMRTVMSRQSYLPEITAESARELNAAIDGFDNAVSEVEQEAGAQSSAFADPSEVPFSDGTDWTASDAPCVTAFNRVQILVARGDVYGALALADEQVRDNPKSPQALAMRGWVRLLARDIQGGRDDISAANKLNPGTFKARVPGHDGIEDTGAPADGLSQTIGAMPGSSDRITQLVASALNNHLLGNDDQALTDSAAALAEQPGIADLRLMRAQIYRSRHDRVKWAKEGELLVREAPRDPVALTIAGAILVSSGHRTEGFAAFDQSLTIEPTSMAYLTRASNRLSTDVSGRLADVQSALALDPDDRKALAMLAELQFEQQDYQGALKTMTQLGSDAGVTGAALALAVINAYAGHTETAREQFAVLRAERVADAQLLNSLCWQAAIRGLWLDQALADCKASLNLEPTRPATLDSLGFVLFRLGRYREALEAYDKVLKQRPEAAVSLFGRSLVLRALNRTAEAAASEAEATKRNPDIRADFDRYTGKGDPGGSGKPAPLNM